MYKIYTKKQDIPWKYTHKIWLVMRLTTVILIATLMQVSAAGMAQRITMQQNKVSLKAVFEQIKQQAGYNVVWKSEQLKNKPAVTANFNNLEVEKVLDLILPERNLDYVVNGSTIVIKEKTPSFLDRLAERWASIDVTGRVLDEKGNPLAGATVRVKGSNQITKTSDKGEFYLSNINEDAVIEINYTGFKVRELKAERNLGNIKMEVLVGELQEVKINPINTGYQEISPERFVGSASIADSSIIMRGTSTDILGRIENQVNGLLFNRGTGLTEMYLRGISTISGASDIANSKTLNPLIVIDNFPYNGDLNSINPNSIENIYILKDAVATSIWGARAGNGVIVITSKKGEVNKKTSINFTSNLLLQSKPDLGYFPRMSSSDFIDVEMMLFDNGFYNGTLQFPFFSPVSPVVEILNKRRQGLIEDREAFDRIDGFRSQNVNKDYEKYVLRNAVNTQNFLSIDGGTSKVGYVISVGADKNQTYIKGPGGSQRYTINSNLSVELIKNLRLTSSINYSDFTRKSDGPGLSHGSSGKSELYPYAKLADENGVALPVSFQYSPTFTDTAGKGRLLDWKYKPLDENKIVDNQSSVESIQFNNGLQYQVLPWLSIDLKHQYGKQTTRNARNRSIESFYTRDLINRFTNPLTFKQVIPIGGILDYGTSLLVNNNIRGQINLRRYINDKHEISGLLATEFSDVKRADVSATIYGYDDKVLTASRSIDFADEYPLYYTPAGKARIPNQQNLLDKNDRFISIIGNASYTFDQKYSVYASARKDGSNILGTNTNNKWKPLWSAGIRWNASNENFLDEHWLNSLVLRATYGYSGNVNNTISAFSTIGRSSSFSFFGQPYATINALANPDLRWEEVRTTNLGLDFSILNGRISSSVDLYSKRSKDLISNIRLDPTVGQSVATKNVANIKGHGFEILVNTKNLVNSFKWSTSLNLSYSKSIVDEYFGEAINTPIGPAIRKGEIWGALYAYRWAGLNPENGDPRGYLNGHISTDYNSIANDTASNQAYIGPSFPTFYGNMLNKFNFKNLELSFNVSFKANYYFKKPSIRYDLLFNSWMGHADFARRWQNKGDEQFTSVPSLRYPVDESRERFYDYSEINIERGDNIRLQDIRLSYNWINSKSVVKFIRSAEVYLYASNLNLFLFKKSKSGYDPDFPTSSFPALSNLSIGVRISL